MAWTNKQKSVAARACHAAGIDDVTRRLILRQFPNAMHHDRPTSTAPHLSNADFEQFMAIVERSGGGALPGYSAGYWQGKAGDALHRMRYRATEIAATLEAAGLLVPGAGLRGWIAKRVTAGETDQFDQLDYHGLRTLIARLSAFARQRGITEPHHAATAAQEQCS